MLDLVPILVPSDAGFHHSPDERDQYDEELRNADAWGYTPPPPPPMHYTVRVMALEGGHIASWHVFEDIAASSACFSLLFMRSPLMFTSVSSCPRVWTSPPPSYSPSPPSCPPQFDCLGMFLHIPLSFISSRRRNAHSSLWTSP